jgi:hypothetical protein
MDKIEVLEKGYAPLMGTVVAWAEDQKAIRGLFVSGSVAQGTADAYSDLDLVAIADQDAVEDLLENAHNVIDEAESIIIEHRLRPGDIRVLSVVTDKWHRIDIAFGDTDSGILQQALMPIFDPDALYDGAPAANAPPPLVADQVIRLSKEFLRILGLFVVGLGRNDVHAGHDGANLLRNMLIELFLMEPPFRIRPGPKKLLPALTDEQQEILKTLPAIADNLAVLIAFSTAVAAVFLPRARRLTETLGGAWPIAAERATRTYLHGTIEM